MRGTTGTTRAALMAAAAIAGLAGAVGGAGFTAGTIAAQTTTQARADQGVKPSKGDRRARLIEAASGSFFRFPQGERRAGYGWTNMHQRRVAHKKRNQARNRSAHRR